MAYLCRQQPEGRTRNTNLILPPTKRILGLPGSASGSNEGVPAYYCQYTRSLEKCLDRQNLTHKQQPERSGPMLQDGRPRDAAFWTQQSGHCERRRVLPSTENRHIDQVWNPWKSGAGHTLHPGPPVSVISRPVEPSTYSQCGSGTFDPELDHTTCMMGCGCAACADAGQECILPSAASPLLAGSWAPPCHRCPTKVCIAGRTGEEQPVLPLWDACHSNYLRSEPLLRRTFIDSACLGRIFFVPV